MCAVRVCCERGCERCQTLTFKVPGNYFIFISPFLARTVMPVQTRRMKENTTTTTEKDVDDQHGHRNKVWAFVGAQSFLCTLAFLALLYLNYQIWKQYFFLILWSFVLSHAFKSTLGESADAHMSWVIECDRVCNYARFPFFFFPFFCFLFLVFRTIHTVDTNSFSIFNSNTHSNTHTHTHTNTHTNVR